MTVDTELNTRLVGFVRIEVGVHVHDVPIRAAAFLRDTTVASAAGGFFLDDDGRAEILVDEGASPDQLRQQIELATDDVVRHFSRQNLN
jgi:hypothetical protein